MKWETPQATEFRFGMEITMYVANRWYADRARARSRGAAHLSVKIRILGAAAGGGFPQWNC